MSAADLVSLAMAIRMPRPRSRETPQARWARKNRKHLRAYKRRWRAERRRIYGTTT